MSWYCVICELIGYCNYASEVVFLIGVVEQVGYQSSINNRSCLVPDSMSNTPPSATGSSSADLFAADDRVHFSKETGTWRFEQEDGPELEYDTTKSQWLPVVSERRSEQHRSVFEGSFVPCR